MYKVSSKVFEEVVQEHSRTLARRGTAIAEEHMPAEGQAYLWYMDVIQQVPDCGKKVAHQIARLCKKDSSVTTSYRSLADAVGEYDKTGPIAYVQRGIRILRDAGWLSVETVGEKRGASTTFFLEAGQDTAYKKKWDLGFYEKSPWRDHHVA